MVDPHSHHDTSGDPSDEDAAPEPGGGSTTGPPRWVKVFGLIGLVLVALILISLLTGHGPAQHMTGGLGGPAVRVGTAPQTQLRAVGAVGAVGAVDRSRSVLLRSGGAS